jgi:hypothetical protein
MISPIVLFARHRLHAATSTGLLLTFFVIISMAPMRNIVGYDDNGCGSNCAVEASTFLLICILPLILLSVAPAKAVSRRLIFLGIGLILLVALNELSKLALDLTAPNSHG